MALKITITDAGRAEITNAENTGTAPVTITHIALGDAGYIADPAQVALHSEVKRVSSIAGEVVAADTISVTAKDEGSDTYTVREFGLITEHGTLFAVYAQTDPIIEKASPSTLLLTIDIVLADLDASSLTFGDISFSNPPASESVAGVVRFADQDEVNSGSIANKVISPETLAARTATISRSGMIQLASQAQADEGKDLTRALTPGHSRVTSDARYLRREQNLGDLANASRARNNLGLKDTAITSMMATSTDSTIGHLVRIASDEGFFGLGNTRSPVATDCNKVNANGFYRLATNTPNAWAGQASGDGLLQWSWDSNYRHQIGVSRGGGGSLWHRSSINGTFSAWRQAVSTGITISAGSGLSGGGDLTANRTLSVDGSVVRTNRTVATGSGLTGGGNLTANRTLSVDSSVVRTSRSISSGEHLSGGGTLEANRALNFRPDTSAWIIDSQGKQRMYFGSTIDDSHILLQASKTGAPKFQLRNSVGTAIFEVDMQTGQVNVCKLPWARLTGHVAVNTGDGLNGGGNLTVSRTLSVDSSVVRTSRTVATGSGLTGGGNLTANRTLAVDGTVVRTSRSISTGNGLNGGGNLTANRTLELKFNTNTWVNDKEGKPRLYFGSTTSDSHILLQASKTGAPKFQLRDSGGRVKLEVDMATGRVNIGNIPWSLLSGHISVLTGSGLTGGGNLGSSRTLSVDSSVVRTSRVVNTGTGLTGGGNLGSDRTLSVDSSVVRTSFFTGGNQSLSRSGYQVFPGGLILQWGTTNNLSPSSRTSFTFPIKFPHECLNITATQCMPDATSHSYADNAPQIYNIGSSGFSLHANDAGGANGQMSYSWQAIGR